MVSQKGTRCFNTESVSAGLDIGNTFIVPAIKELTSQASVGDEVVVEKIREEWCNCLEQSSLTEGSYILLMHYMYFGTT